MPEKKQEAPKAAPKAPPKAPDYGKVAPPVKAAVDKYTPYGVLSKVVGKVPGRKGTSK